MTDLFDEWWTQRFAIAQARERGGEVLITGLGLGLVVASILEPPNERVRRVVVIERSAEVIDLVAPQLEDRYGGRISVIRANAFEWLPPTGRRFGTGWHDIWPNPHEPGVMAQAEALERRFAPYCDWQGNWVHEYRAVEEAEQAARTT